MGHLGTIRKMYRIEGRLSRIERNIEEQLEDIDEKLKSYEEVDKFDQIVELIMLFCTSFKLIILGAAIIIPWNSIRDFWVKISMCIFIVKSSKRFRKTWKKVVQKDLKDTASTTSTSHETDSHHSQQLVSKKQKEKCFEK